MTTNKVFSLIIVACLLSVMTSFAFGLGKDDSLLVYIAFILAVFIGNRVVDWFVRSERVHNWCTAEGTIESCDDDGCVKGTQGYICAYVFRPDATRQGGTFLIYEPASYSDNRLEQIRKELVGLPVRVRYDPKDCTRCIVEDKQLLDWDVVND